MSSNSVLSISFAAFVAAFFVSAGAATAQEPAADSARVVMFANDEWERYARVLQQAGRVPLYPWSVRAFGPHGLKRLRPTDSVHPWAGAQTVSVRTRRLGGIELTPLPARVQTTFNSAFPYGYNDGPVWAGRGLTTAAHVGFVARAGPVTFTAAPMVFRAENAAFELRPNGQSGLLSYGDAFLVPSVDHPQRFGATAYGRFDAGNTSLRLDVSGVALGLSTANQSWGPAQDHPLLLGNNAAGFPHVFIETARPANLWVGHLHGRVIWGRLEQTPYIDIQPRSRLAMGIVAVVVPRGLPGLELGGARFFHVLWSDSALTGSTLTKPFSALLKIGRIGAAGNPLGDEPDNQLASLFGRWVFPEGGVELYGEYAREDNSWNMRDVLVEPDHNAGYMVGLQRSWSRNASERSVARLEVINTRISAIAIARAQAPFYVHSPIRQGHTHLGQVLGSVGAMGGGGSVVALDRYSKRGRWTVSWARTMRAENRAGPLPTPGLADVMHAVSVDALRFRGRMALRYEITAVQELNRNFASNAFNVRLSTGAQYAW
jgi:hypothetical protein